MKSSSANGKMKTRPNVLLIVMDAARARSLSCYGYHRPTTPNLEKFAERNVLYETAISAAGWSLPAHASIFTGLYPSKHGAHDEHKYLLPASLTMAEVLRSHGYHTLAFCYNAYVSSATALDRGFDEFNRFAKKGPRPLNKILNYLDRGLAVVQGQRDSGARIINKQVNLALNRLQNSQKQPFFLFVHYEEPHAPYQPPRNYYTRYLSKGVSTEVVRQVNQDRWKYFADPSSMTEQDFEVLTALYDAEITYLDTKIAEIITWLEDINILDHTMVIITADHGENIGDHGMMGHAYCLYDTLVHVPLIIHYPQGTTQPGRVSHQIQTLDLLPTILSLLDATDSDLYRSLQGYDLLSSTRHPFTIAEQTHPDLSTFYDRFPEADVSHFNRALKMIRTDRYKYIWDSLNEHELYDLASDLDEKHNIIYQKPDIAKDLDRQLTEWRHSFEPANVSSDTMPEFDEEMKERLRALGYLE